MRGAGRWSPAGLSMRCMESLLTRRSVLRGGALIAGSGALPSLSRLHAQVKKTPLLASPVKLGVASYTFRKFDAAHLIEFMKQLRTPYLNLKDTHLPMGTAAAVKAQADAYRAAGLTLTAAGTIYFAKDEDADLQAKFDYCKAAGISLIVGAPTHATLARVEAFVKRYDIRVAIHNHGPEDKEWPSPLDVLKAVGSMDPRMGCCIDVGHTVRAGVDVVEAIRRAGPRLFDLHMKDLAKSDAKDSQVAVGEGILPIREIFQELIRMRYAGYADLEYEIKEDDPLPGVMESFAYMRGVLTGLGYSTVE